MLRTVIITRPAEKQLKRLDTVIQERILHKLAYFATLPNPQMYAEVLVDFKYGAYRFRVGDYRIIVDFDERGKLIIVAIIAHRRDVYK